MVDPARTAARGNIRALSPAVNDPTTAVQVLNHIESFLGVVGRERLRARYVTADDRGRRAVRDGGTGPRGRRLRGLATSGTARPGESNWCEVGGSSAAAPPPREPPEYRYRLSPGVPAAIVSASVSSSSSPMVSSR
ncbi:DUF2254 family protein [Embleya sp. NPDC050493]|uniref:DUF2254 family protein n=1 Tax=Embleya sp. NPDC050493 TaxID=3363989 RepID=UPI00378732EE